MWRPQVYDLVAHYEPRSDFSLTHGIRAAVKDLGRKYRGRTLMAGAHAGTPVIHTDMRGISIGTRLEISRLALREKDRQPLVAEVFRMFREAAEQGIASGPIDRMTVKFPNAESKPDARQPIHDAYQEVFDSPCCFQRMQDPHTLRLGRAVVHQALIHHLREDGPYHSDHQPRVERVYSELGRRPGRYEGYQYFVEPIFTPGEHPEVVFHYSGDEPSRIIEVTMRQKSEEELHFMTTAEMRANPARFVSLIDYDQGARRFGRLWVMQEGLLRRLDREWLPLIYLFMDDDLNPLLDAAFTWEELYERQRMSRYVPRTQRMSSTFLDICIERLSERFLVLREGGRFRLQPLFNDVQHVTFYELGHYDKRLG